MKITDFDMYRDLLHEKSGLVLTQDKSYLLESRLKPISKQWGYDTLDAMTMALQGVPDPALIKDIVEAMTTNETSFFRDTRPFDIFKQTVLSFMKDNRKTKKIRIWCAAASSGQEPYTLAIILKEMATEFPGWTFEIIATDISTEILDQAREGRYTQFEVQRGLPIQLLMKYFAQDGDHWQLNKDVRKMVTYKEFNLLNPMAGMGNFDVILCRNVLIYFDDETKKMVLGNLTKQLVDDGFLFLGGAETVLGICDALKPVPGQRGLYAHTEGPHMQAAKTDTQALA